MSCFALLALVALTLTDGSTITGPAGVYTVTTTGQTTVTSGPGWVKIEWEVEPNMPEKPAPPPVKPPDPGIVPTPPVVVPPPTPTPTPPTVTLPVLTGPIWLAAVYDRTTAATLPAAQQALLLSKTIGPALAKPPYNATWSAWDKSDPGLKDWGPEAGTTYPALLVIWNQGTASKSWPLPADENAMMSFAGKLRGQ